MKTKILCSFFFFSFQMLFAQSLMLDPTFGINGKVLNSFYVFDDKSKSVAILDDGKILVCGVKHFSFEGNVYLARYNADGSMDATFGSNGIVFTILSAEFGGMHNVKLLPDGNILVTGSKALDTDHNSFDFATMRYHSDGSLDTTFGTNGIVKTDIDGRENIANAIDILSDGKIIVAGNTSIFGHGNYTTLVRYLADGTIDTAFGTDGKVMLNQIVVDATQFIWDIKIRSDESILLGVITDAFEPYVDFGFKNIAILKIDSNGNLDSTFGTNGSVVTDFVGRDILYGIDEYQGNIFAAGHSKSNGSQILLAKYLPNGTPDISFGIEGKVKINKDATSFNDGLYSLKVQTNGKILCAGWTGVEDAMDGLLIQFNADGTIDNGFNGTGYLVTDFDAMDNSSCTFAIQPDGKLLCAGWAGVNSNYDSVLIRYDVSALATTHFKAENEFSIFPNPFADKINLSLNIDIPENLSVDLFDANGRKIQNLLQDKPFPSGKNVIALSMPESLSEGIYFIKISGDSLSTTLKITK